MSVFVELWGRPELNNSHTRNHNTDHKGTVCQEHTKVGAGVRKFQTEGNWKELVEFKNSAEAREGKKCG